MNLVVAQD